MILSAYSSCGSLGLMLTRLSYRCNITRLVAIFLGVVNNAMYNKSVNVVPVA